MKDSDVVAEYVLVVAVELGVVPAVVLVAVEPAAEPASVADKLTAAAELLSSLFPLALSVFVAKSNSVLHWLYDRSQAISFWPLVRLRLCRL